MSDPSLQTAVVAGVGPGLGAALVRKFVRKFVREGCRTAMLARSGLENQKSLKLSQSFEEPKIDSCQFAQHLWRRSPFVFFPTRMITNIHK